MPEGSRIIVRLAIMLPMVLLMLTSAWRNVVVSAVVIMMMMDDAPDFGGYGLMIACAIDSHRQHQAFCLFLFRRCL